MKVIALNRLHLRNFKGMTFSLDIDGNDTDIYGANATGKTTLADALSWLLFDKDSIGRSDFEIKNINSDGATEHGLEHIVEGTLVVDGSTIALKKSYHEIWAKKRGNAQAVLSGNTTDYFIDGVPVQKKDYTQRIAEMAGDENIFRLLTSPGTFPALHWTKQRALLLEICGDMTDFQVIEADSRLAPLLDIRKKRTIDDHKKVVAARKAEINKELDKIPIRIDEVRRSVPDTSGLDREALQGEIKRLEANLSDARLKLAGIDNGGDIAGLSKELAVVNSDITRLENTHYAKHMIKVRNIDQLIAQAKDTIEAEERKRTSIVNTIQTKKGDIEAIEAKLIALREKWAFIDAETFQDTTEEVCAACGQSLPYDRVEEARDKARAEFNRKKAERLTDIETEGKRYALNKDVYMGEIKKLHSQMPPEPENNSEDIAKLTAERDAEREMATDYTQIPGMVELTGKRTSIEMSIEAAKGSISIDRDAISLEISAINEKLRDTRELADRFIKMEQAAKRIEQLKAEEKTMTTEYEALEGELYLLELFIKTKVKLLTDRINSKFELARFKLFDVQVNGGIAECCEIMVNGIPYNSNLNSGMKINAGLDVCKTLSRHYGLQVPTFVDNAETVCRLIDMETQIIRLIVSGKDPALRVIVLERRIAA